METNVQRFWRDYDGFCRNASEREAFVNAIVLSDVRLFQALRNIMFPNINETACDRYTTHCNKDNNKYKICLEAIQSLAMVMIVK